MPYRFAQLNLEPERFEALHRAFDKACEALGIKDLADPMVEVLAAKLIEFSNTNEFDPDRLHESVLSDLREHKGSAD
jgi:hypothetical protein